MWSKPAQQNNESQKNVFTRARWLHYLHLFAFFMLMVLDIGFVMSAIQVGQHSSPIKALIMLFFLAVCNLLIISTLLLQVDSIIVTPEQLILKNLLLKRKENWQDLNWSSPPYLKFAILRSKKFIYLLNKRDIRNFDQLTEIIEHKTKQ